VGRLGYVVVTPKMEPSVPAPVVLRFADDLRLADNPALAAAVESGRPVLPVFVDDPEQDAHWAPGPTATAWLDRSLDALDAALRSRGSHLLRVSGEAGPILVDVCRLTGADTVYRSRRRWPTHVRSDALADQVLRRAGVRVHAYDTQLLHDPDEVLTAGGAPYTVFGPFCRKAETRLRLDGLSEAPARVPAPETWPVLPPRPGPAPAAGTSVAALPDWTPGEAGAREALTRFLGDGLEQYGSRRDLPSARGTSLLSPHLRFGEISPARVWETTAPLADSGPFRRQLMWREFAYGLLQHFPRTPERPLHAEFAAFPWSRDFDGLVAWQGGMTGFPFVDAGMREMLATGWMHNRVRMVVASFLVKDLLLPWQQGAMWFWRALADADLANNTLGWQWVAGCGADAAPYVRVFNPVTQGEHFDPGGVYVRRWVPALADVPDRWVHRPWEAPASVLLSAGVVLDRDYPAPIVDHREARRRALAVFAALRSTRP
jgi:deoxyribodipyrimidine photo-lyase